EAIRGEGATLLDAEGKRFVDELSPRDEVSRAIQAQLELTGARSVALDMRSIDPARFPNVVGSLRQAGLDPATELIPVAPAAHYMMGGILTDMHASSTLPGLYAVGESSCTGLHGANRLASNSLSECFVFARRAVEHALASPAGAASRITRSQLEALLASAPPERADARTRDALWRYAGIVRSQEGLQALLQSAHPLVRLIAQCGLQRAESRGAHQRLDHPQRNPALDYRHVTIDANGAARWQSWT